MTPSPDSGSPVCGLVLHSNWSQLPLEYEEWTGNIYPETPKYKEILELACRIFETNYTKGEVGSRFGRGANG
jgi:hypothetical protein